VIARHAVNRACARHHQLWGSPDPAAAHCSSLDLRPLGPQHPPACTSMVEAMNCLLDRNRPARDPRFVAMPLKKRSAPPTPPANGPHPAQPPIALPAAPATGTWPPEGPNTPTLVSTLTASRCHHPPTLNFPFGHGECARTVFPVKTTNGRTSRPNRAANARWCKGVARRRAPRGRHRGSLLPRIALPPCTSRSVGHAPVLAVSLIFVVSMKPARAHSPHAEGES